MDTFSEQQRAAAIGTWTAWTGIATVAGPLLGGLLVQIASWRWVFLINVPLVLVTLGLARAIPPSPHRAEGGVDWVGGALGALGLGGPIYALIEQPTYGWGDARVLGTLAAGCALLLAFALWERRCRAPMLPFRIFRARNFSVGNLMTLSLYGGLSVTSFFLVVFLQQVGGYRPLLAGLSMLPTSILLFLLARRFGALADRYGPRLFMGVGPIIAGCGLLLLLRVGSRPLYVADVLPGVVLLGLGLSVAVAPLTAAVLSAAPASRSGVASAINNAVSRVAGLVAIAVVGAVVAAHFSSDVEHGLALPHAARAYRDAVSRAASAALQVHPPRQLAASQRSHFHSVLEHASVASFHLAMAVAAALALAAGILSLAGIRNRR